MISQVTVLLTMSPVRLVSLRGHVSWLSTARTGTMIRIAQAETVTSIQWRNDMTRPYTEYLAEYTNVVARVQEHIKGTLLINDD